MLLVVNEERPHLARAPRQADGAAARDGNPYKIRLADLAPARPMTRDADPDGDEPPATATAYVADIPKIRPNPSTIEGMLAFTSDLAAASSSSDPRMRRRARTLAGVVFGVLTLGAPLGWAISRAFG